MDFELRDGVWVALVPVKAAPLVTPAPWWGEGAEVVTLRHGSKWFVGRTYRGKALCWNEAETKEWAAKFASDLAKPASAWGC